MEMMQLSFASAVVYSLIFFVFLLVKQLLKPKSHKKLPPGPWTLPIIGNLHQILGALPHRIFKDLSDKYGPLMRIMMGERTTIIVSSATMAKVVLHTHGLAVANRPINSVAKVICYNNLGVTFAEYGEYLKQLRQLYMLELLSPKRVQSFSAVFEDELQTFVKSIKSEVGQPMIIYEKSVTYLYSTICRVMLGNVCNEREKLIKICKKVSFYSAAPIRIEDLFPSMKFIISRIFSTNSILKDLLKDLDDVLDIVIAERENSQYAQEEEDMLGILLKHKRSDGNNSKLKITNKDIKAIIFELLLAATLSVADVVEWAMVEILRHPKVLKQVHDEVRQAFKGQKTITGSDLGKLEYLHMCFKESTRLHPAAPLLFPREAREEFEIDGYTIPKGSWVLTNYWAVGRDPRIWPKPDEFDPERFRNSDIEFYGNHFELIPFGTGRRGCPGILFGITEALYLLAALFYHFDWKLAGGITPEEIDMTEVFGAGCILKNPLNLIPRLAEN
uniref:Rhazimal synthase n=1 Tax=Alstonia scholaris TaxID=52822 RepID=RHS_ALSSC|nr:rhazimal synthase [Alstonia scholaris]